MIRYVINSVSPYVDGATPKVNVDVSAYADNVLLLQRPLVFPVDAIKKTFT
jgi:hypothetical protein